jgi:phosphate starvation-inducible PhoH-like protein|tara:strand:+ start:1006 stop:1212 length:207 start_codon:yes stop_codon:yes gene_type:complete
MQMLLTRLGPNSKMVITGDLRQSDIGKAMDCLMPYNDLRMEQIAIVNLDRNDIVRHHLVGKIAEKYEL